MHVEGLISKMGKVIYSTFELSKKENVKYGLMPQVKSISDLVDENGEIKIIIKGIVRVEGIKQDTGETIVKDYYIAEDGVYSSSSESLRRVVEEVLVAMGGEECEFRIYKRQSKNRAGAKFLMAEFI